MQLVQRSHLAALRLGWRYLGQSRKQVGQHSILARDAPGPALRQILRLGSLQVHQLHARRSVCTRTHRAPGCHVRGWRHVRLALVLALLL